MVDIILEIIERCYLIIAYGFRKILGMDIIFMKLAVIDFKISNLIL